MSKQLEHGTNEKFLMNNLRESMRMMNALELRPEAGTMITPMHGVIEDGQTLMMSANGKRMDGSIMPHMAITTQHPNSVDGNKTLRVVARISGTNPREIISVNNE